MTTVVCLHAAVAQKSYGSEKRFLCPPPLVRIEGPFGAIREQKSAMSLVSETGERAPEAIVPLDSSMTASFKFLHVTGTAKSKSFQLALDIAEPSNTIPDPADNTPAGRVWASFESAPVTIISKPSKKTAKTRNIGSCILAGGPVSLFNRINSQTVRTKYMTIEHNQLCASNIAWSAFAVNVVRAQGTENPLGMSRLRSDFQPSLTRRSGWAPAGHLRQRNRPRRYSHWRADRAADHTQSRQRSDCPG